MNPDLRVAVFDGGLQQGTDLARWASSFDGQGVGSEVPALLEHGYSVTSAVLFGTLHPGEAAPQPYATVDHYRVLDDKCKSDPFELFDVLRRVDEVLRQRQYNFFNLSMGPDLPIEDDEVHSWTALLDSHLSDGHALAAIAVGNNGLENHALGEARVQVPSDCVNALGVGAADSARAGWNRARYSAIGPGRTPGRIKPDVLHFGGDQREPFMVYDQNAAPAVAATAGTSFASPAALRLALGVRAHFGERISPLGLKALLIHCADPGGYDRAEVGWGRLPQDIEPLVVCPEGKVRIVYQGDLTPSTRIRALIPLPDEQLRGNVAIAATFCYACQTDPEDPVSYTRSGLDITFRPHSAKFKDSSAADPAPKSFFRKTLRDNERVLREGAQKWETTLNEQHSFRGSSLQSPMFDIHYTARTSGGPAKEADKIRYALVVTVTSLRTADLYDRVLTKYAGRLEALRPIVEIPVQVGT
ncbi:S8 family peptidase [Nonomuraea sp. PA05]|uniref:S8 family peptidase n=1 Tax=Nonomuraea sp. PA05 TaxID=2604466 RepID=UPI001651C43C|nr:S8 family peptidase [Nonomuraea sp. PA05]